ncbi:MAG: heavy-metal-associated domain-containing protein [Lachnospiraceae bacterium]|nr:heavy-metal-associated domain-containing protein [Lachnospiraceae bacterium]
MVETIIGIDGMACGMCENHINEAIRNHFRVKKVKADRKKKRAVVVSEEALDTEAVRKVIAETGYDFIDMTESSYEKKGLFG